jgi:hypothetical protein
MTIKHSCGGRFRRSDIVAVQLHGRTMYADTDNLVAHWTCDRCGAKREQRKRQLGKRKMVAGDII